MLPEQLLENQNMTFQDVERYKTTSQLTKSSPHTTKPREAWSRPVLYYIINYVILLQLQLPVVVLLLLKIM